MTETRYIPLCNLLTYALWSWVVLAIAVGWICSAAGQQHLAVMLGLTACASSAIAATATIRLFALRTQALIRTMRDIEPAVVPALVPLRP